MTLLRSLFFIGLMSALSLSHSATAADPACQKLAPDVGTGRFDSVFLFGRP